MRQLALMCTFVVVASSLSAAERPNFILINIDDLGYADIGPYGSKNRTPNLDRMAREGRLLTSHYAAPVCSPSRAALMTGSYAKRALPIPGVLFPAGAVGLNPDERTIAEVLKDAGYATGAIGKWHLGDQPEFLPRRQGFDYYFGIPYSNDMGPPADGAKGNPGAAPATKKKANPKAPAKAPPADDVDTGIRGNEQPPLPLLENDTVIGRVRREEQFSLTRTFTDKAVSFMREHRAGNFFLYLPHYAVHFPLHPAPEFAGKSPNGAQGDWVEELDSHIGRLFDTLRELNLDRRTLVIFTSDNGGPLAHGANNTPLRGGKAQTLEGGIRTCTIAWWPGNIPAGTKTAAITSMMDVLPTFAALAGAKLPTDRKIDGVDQWPVLAGTAGAKAPREEFFYFRGLILDAVRSGPWKLHLARGELYHLEDDIGEAKNVAAANPEVVRRLRGLAEAMGRDLGVEGIGPGCRPLGRVANPQPLIADDGTVRAGFAGKAAKFP